MLRIESNRLYFTGGVALDIEAPLTIRKGLTVITGPNGSGKSIFVKILEKGRNFRTNCIVATADHYPKIKCLEFNDIHSFTGLSVGYYQQRYEASMNDEVPTVGEILGHRTEDPLFSRFCRQFDLIDVDSKKINYLSSGELRKILIINALLENPDVLILDNPYIGLDVESRKNLDSMLLKMKQEGRSVILVMAEKADAPEFADYFLYASDMKISRNESSSGYKSVNDFEFENRSASSAKSEILDMRDCKVYYGSRKLIDNLNWKVSSGEWWRLSGPNGSGKSTLLSLINADNPKGYCNDISIFGRRRGSGESIWDIKKHIGYVSPEMQLHFHGSGSVLQILANGLNDTVGLYVKPTESQLEKARRWLEHFRITHLAERQFSTLSAGERQLVLVARSFIKEPLLLILDEPMHGLDTSNIGLVQHTLSSFMSAHPASASIIVTHRPEYLLPSWPIRSITLMP